MNETPAAAPTTASSAHSGRGRPRLPIWARWLIAALGMVVSALSGALMRLPLVGLGLGGWVDARHSGIAALGQVLLLAAVYGAPTVAAFLLLWGLSRLEGVRLRDYLGTSRRGAARFLGHAAAVAVPTTTISLVLGRLGAHAGRATAEFSSSSTLVIVAVLVFSAVLMQGIPEELWFRGLAWASAGSRPWLTLAGTTLVFTCLHVVSSGGQTSAADRLTYLLLPLGMGFLAGCARWCTGSVWAAAGTHSGLHLGMIPVYLLGVPTGPWGWITLGGLQLGTGAVLLVVHRPWDRLR